MGWNLAMVTAGSTLAVLDSVTAVLASAGALALLVVSSGPGSRALLSRVLYTARARTVLKEIVDAGLCATTDARRSAKNLNRGLLEGVPHDVNGELAWLFSVVPGRLPPTFVGDGSAHGHEDLGRLSVAYERMAGRLKARLVIGTRGSELVSVMSDIAMQTAAALREHSTNTRMTPVGGAMEIDLRARGSFARVYYTDHSLDLAISSCPSRLESADLPLPQGGSQFRFEGILPHLLDQQIEIDHDSGRQRLHLALGEIPYSALLAKNTPPWDPREIPVSSGTHAVSLALLPVTSDGYVLFARRADGAGSYPGMLGPYVTGNAELRDRRGLRADRRADGVPDLLAALCREAHEEVGVSLRPEDLRLLGISQIWSLEDKGIWCLMATAALSITKDEAAEQVRHGDPVEGSWEIGSELVAVDPWADSGAADIVLRWAAGADVVPQGVACLAALLVKSGSSADVDWAEASSRSDLAVGPWLHRIPTRHPFR